jgi:hypothetical protein
MASGALRVILPGEILRRILLRLLLMTQALDAAGLSE